VKEWTKDCLGGKKQAGEDEREARLGGGVGDRFSWHRKASTPGG